MVIASRRTALLRAMLALMICLSAVATLVPTTGAADESAGVASAGPSGSPVTPVALLSRVRATVNSRISYTLGLFTPFEDVAISWKQPNGSVIPLGVVSIDAFGGATGSFKVPATPGGANQQVQFVQGQASANVLFEIIPRIKVLPDPTQRGQTVNVSLRGYAKGENVRIRWKKGSSFVVITTVKTSSSGSANVNVVVPGFAPDGENTVRGDGTVFRSETKSVTINGGPLASIARAATSTPNVTATIEPPETPSPAPEPTTEPTLEPTTEPAIEVTPVTTPEPDPTEEPSPEIIPEPTEATEPSPEAPVDGTPAGI